MNRKVQNKINEYIIVIYYYYLFVYLLEWFAIQAKLCSSALRTSRFLDIGATLGVATARQHYASNLTVSGFQLPSPLAD